MVDSVISWAILTVAVFALGIYFLLKCAKNNKVEKEYFIKW